MSVIYPVLPAVGGEARATVNWGGPLIVIDTPRAIKFYDLDEERLSLPVTERLDAAAAFRPAGAQQDWLALLSRSSLRVITYKNGNFQELYDSRRSTVARMMIPFSGYVTWEQEESVKCGHIAVSPDHQSLLARYYIAGDSEQKFFMKLNNNKGLSPKAVLLRIEDSDIQAQTFFCYPQYGLFEWADKNRICACVGGYHDDEGGPYVQVYRVTKTGVHPVGGLKIPSETINAPILRGTGSELVKVITQGKVVSVDRNLAIKSESTMEIDVRRAISTGDLVFFLARDGVYTSKAGGDLVKVSSKSGTSMCIHSEDAIVLSEVEGVSLVKADGTVHAVMKRRLPITGFTRFGNQFKVVLAAEIGSIIRTMRSGLVFRELKSTPIAPTQIFMRRGFLVIGLPGSTRIVDLNLDPLEADIITSEPTLAMTDDVQVTTRQVIGLKTVHIELAMAKVSGNIVFGAHKSSLHTVDCRTGHIITRTTVEPVVTLAISGTITAYAVHNALFVNTSRIDLAGVRQLAVMGDCVVACTRKALQLIIGGELQSSMLAIDQGFPVLMSDYKCLVLSASGHGAIVRWSDHGFAAFTLSGLPHARIATYNDGMLVSAYERLTVWQPHALQETFDEKVNARLYHPLFTEPNGVLSLSKDVLLCRKAAEIMHVSGEQESTLHVASGELYLGSELAHVELLGREYLLFVLKGDKSGYNLCLYDLETRAVLDRVQFGDPIRVLQVFRNKANRPLGSCYFGIQYFDLNRALCRFPNLPSQLWLIDMQGKPKLLPVADSAISHDGYGYSGLNLEFHDKTLLRGSLWNFYTELEDYTPDKFQSIKIHGYGWSAEKILPTSPAAALTAFSTGRLVEFDHHQKKAFSFCEAVTEFMPGIERNEYIGSSLLTTLAPETYFSTLEGGIYGYTRVDSELHSQLLKVPGCASQCGLVDAQAVLNFCKARREFAAECLGCTREWVLKLEFALWHWHDFHTLDTA